MTFHEAIELANAAKTLNEFKEMAIMASKYNTHGEILRFTWRGIDISINPDVAHSTEMLGAAIETEMKAYRK